MNHYRVVTIKVRASYKRRLAFASACSKSRSLSSAATTTRSASKATASICSNCCAKTSISLTNYIWCPTENSASWRRVAKTRRASSKNLAFVCSKLAIGTEWSDSSSAVKRTCKKNIALTLMPFVSCSALGPLSMIAACLLIEINAFKTSWQCAARIFSSANLQRAAAAICVHKTENDQSISGARHGHRFYDLILRSRRHADCTLVEQRTRNKDMIVQNKNLSNSFEITARRVIVAKLHVAFFLAKALCIAHTLCTKR